MLDPRTWLDLDQPLFLLGYGVEDPSRGIHGDEEYLYVVDLPEVDYPNPDGSPDWTVRVSEPCGFPRWDGPTDRAFEAASWANEVLLGEAMAGLGIKPAWGRSMKVYCPACGTPIDVDEARLFRGFGTTCATCETWLEFSMDGEDMVVRAGP